MRPGRLLRLGGAAAGLVGGLVTALWEVFLSPLYLGRIPVPLSPVLAVAGNLALAWFVWRVTGRGGLAVLPGVAWFIPMLLATAQGPGGDTLIPGGGTGLMGLITILVGAGAWGVAGYRLAVLRAAGNAAAAAGGGPAADARVPAAAPGAAARPGPKPAAWSRPAPGARPGGSSRRR